MEISVDDILRGQFKPKFVAKKEELKVEKVPKTDATGRLSGVSSTPAIDDMCIVCLGDLKYKPDE